MWLEHVPTNTAEIVVLESLSTFPQRVVGDHVQVVAVVGEDCSGQTQLSLCLLFEELDDQVQMVPSLTRLPVSEEVSPGCRGQAPSQTSPWVHQWGPWCSPTPGWTGLCLLSVEGLLQVPVPSCCGQTPFIGLRPPKG